MNYYSPAGGPPDNDPEDGSAQAHDASPEQALPREEVAAGIDRILRALERETRMLDIPLCTEFIAAARQEIADRLGGGVVASGD